MKKLLFAAVFVFWGLVSYAQVKVIAHRGFWNVEGAAQNSIASLKNAHKIGVYGSEFDAHITSDGIPVVNHDDKVGNFLIEATPYSKIKDIRLKNGEKLPTLKEYLSQYKKIRGTQYIYEIKAHKDKSREDLLIEKSLEMIRKNKMEKQVEFISFSLHACEQLKKVDPSAVVYFLGGSLSPEEIRQKGFTGMDYYQDVFLKDHPEWIKEAHDLGLKVDVFTVDNKEDMKALIRMGVDYITTNNPMELRNILRGNE